MKQNPDLEKEFISMVNRNSKILFRVCWMYFSTEDYEFEDLRQEILLALWKEYCQYGLTRFGTADETTWTYTVALRAAMVFNRNHARHHHKESSYPTLPEQIQITSHSDDIESLHQLISVLNADEKRWVSYYLGHYSYEAISSIEKISKDYARKRMSRAIHKLRILLNKHF
ncbi:MAG: sigma-70 family RNA polymerase sigma factor [Bacteroidales bacterium]|nr:sigma-70 family RNA polymerase sigma factor [Bacteroidales bacterium]